MSFLKVSEMFYSIQGEGQTSGKPAVFLRLQSCNLLCGGIGAEVDNKTHNGATWVCDTIQTWLRGQKYTYEELVNYFSENYKLIFYNNAHLIITGGEPLLQIDAIKHFLHLLQCSDVGIPVIEIETNGTIDVAKSELLDLINFWNVSPKLANSGMSLEKRYNQQALETFSILPKYQVIFKFVISSEADLDEVLQYYIERFSIDTRQVWLMPSASNRNELQKNSILCVEACKKYGYNFSSRLQIQIWDKTVGV